VQPTRNNDNKNILNTYRANISVSLGFTLFTGRPVLVSGFRQVIFGLIAAGLTFAIGRLISVSVAG
jgi:hypothetical protein